MKQEIKDRIEKINRGEVPEGYKKTQIGMLPLDWHPIPIKKVGKIVTGNTPSTKDRGYYGNEFLFVSPLDISDKKYVNQTEKKLSEKGIKVARKVPANTILITCIGSTIGKIAKAKIELSTNQQINAVICNNKHDSDYVYYSLSHYFNIIKRKVTATQAVPIINKAQFSETLIPQLDKLEQEAIASILSTWDRAIELKEQLIEEKKKLKKGLMQNLLTRKVRFPGFDGEWKKVPLSKLVFMESGKRPKGGVSTIGDVPSLGGENIYNENGLKLDVVKKVSLDFYNQLNSGKIRYGDVLINKDGANTGKVAWYLYDMFPKTCINEHLFLLRSKTELVNNGFIYYYLCSSIGQNDLKKYIASSAQPGLNSNFIKTLMIPIPSIDEQNKIVDLLYGIDEFIEQINQELDHLKQQKKGLMQLLLTGIVRVNITGEGGENYENQSI